ncbi:hypothetical protein HYALB_00001391 [Hymenoscyphus albidus]|uniref:Ras guanine nucleotide exchange factor A n=1 Tax=Hymenoscyphus albidus TaxID=595503 RepID=A0A9N9LEL5_9HELO|nr:hypothetical protein HYALB_00001391 [Hymenoscyphus albidus]
MDALSRGSSNAAAAAATATAAHQAQALRGPALASSNSSSSSSSSTSTSTTPRILRLSSRTVSAPVDATPPLMLQPGDYEYSGQRDSIASLFHDDDPFFKQFQSPQTALELRTARERERQRQRQREHAHVRAPVVVAVDNPAMIPPQSRSASGMATINIAVMGGGGVGKTTFTQNALGLRSLPTSITSSLRMSVDNIVYTVSLIELALESFDIAQDRRIEWPKQINGQMVPRMDGALLLYDVMNRDSIAALPQALNGLVDSALPTILVSCKCDNPENTRQINVESMEAACHSCVEALKTAATVPESARLCLASMLKAIMEKRNAPADVSAAGIGTRPRATSISASSHHQHLETSLSQQTRHSRSSSEYSLLRGFPSPPLVSSRHPPSPRSNLHNQFTIPDPHTAPPLSSHPAFRDETLRSADPSSKILTASNPRSPLLSQPIDNNNLEMEESDVDSSYRYSDDTSILQRNDDNNFGKPAKVTGVTFDELVDRLLAQVMTRADCNFIDIFLCLYRKFAAPGELFTAILARLETVTNDRNTHYLTRTSNQLRIVTVIAKWVASYPGDFASSSTSQALDRFINQLLGEPVFMAAAHEIRMQLQCRVVEDDDTDWARTDADAESESGSIAESTYASSSRPSQSAKSDLVESVQNLHVEDEEGIESDRFGSRAGSTYSGPRDSLTQSFSASLYTVEDYEKEAAKMLPKANLPLTKFRYRIFMDISEDDIADEMTRIDWVMFSSIRVRDLVRHVSLSLEQKEKCKSLANVNRMISHFNHIAHWVANMILIRDKAKHRAQMMEKFMTVALKLRQLNNYNGLAAVLAGINGTAIHRLAQTRALVPTDVQKRFARLVLLMGTQKSHFAYRLAWENSPVPRIPFVPLTRRDLVSAEEGSRTFVGANGERINWKKFEVLSEVVLPIMKSQVLPYPNLNKNDDARGMILDCKMPIDDEAIYQRSLSLESTSGSVDFTKKKFPWFQK